ncbi:tetratricopeptide repeat protein [Erythrobacter insulae]|uniref:Tetratricopeptide repeat protein n=1 Tax=Erythrobacter insulae TaxID=2584124 RepID=A0A547P8E2_9SPHN|nr:tetratricopeptide repeat protein [Erythrobacter insulae]TRD10412.1 tetratricopeptide repeat protein [Erythrobacter insulae]
MLTKAIKHLVTAAAGATLLGLGVPAVAETDLQIDGFEATIAKAKSRMVADPAAALSFAREAQTLVGADDKTTAKSNLTARWLVGEALMRLNRSDEASATIETALNQASQSFKDDKIYADLLRSAASSKARAGEYKHAMAYFSEASDKYQKLGDARSRAIVLQNIGSLFSQARDYEEVLRYYRVSAEVFSDQSILSLSANNNMGNALKGLKRFEEAEEKFGVALAIAQKMKSPLLEARILTNMASSQISRGATDTAHETADRAFNLANEHAPDWKPFIYGVLAQVELKRGNVANASDQIGLAFADQDIAKTNALFRDFHETAAEVFTRTGDLDLAKRHKTAFERLDLEANALQL